MENAKEMRIIMTSVSTYDEANQLARIVINEKLAAKCKVVLNTISCTGWHGSFNEKMEYQMLFQTNVEKVARLRIRILEMLYNDTPEVIVLKVEACNAKYLDWVNQTLNTDA
jgi:periplasmic divalent cation tolerance protein